MFLPARIDLKQRRRPPLCGLSKSGKLMVSLTCESASPGSCRFPRHANQQVREADGFPDMRISKSGKLTVSLTCESASPGSRCFQKNLDANPEKSGFCGKSSTPAHVRFFPKPFISFASAQLRLRWHSPCARRLQPEVADRKPGGCERPRGHNPRAVVTGFKIYMRCARRTVPPGRKRAP